MNDPALDLAELVRAEIARQQPFQIMQVESVRDDGTVNLHFGDSIVEAVPANQSYAPRADGDIVMVLQTPAGWRVIDRVGPPAKIELPETLDLAFGPGAPDSSYTQAKSVWVKDGKIWVQTGEGPGQEGPGTPPVVSTPKPVTIGPSQWAGYRSGRRDGDRVAQGAWPSYPKPWSGMWYYGNRLTEALSKAPVKEMRVRVARTGARHGISGKATPRLGLHAHGTVQNTTPSLSHRFNGTPVGLGQSAWTTVPGAQAEALKSGAAKGLGISAPVGSDYLVTGAGSGTITITYQ